MNPLRIFGLARLPRRPRGHPPFAFHDQNGVAYFAWEDPSKIPPIRMAEVEAIMLQIDAGLSNKELGDISECISREHGKVLEAKTLKEAKEAVVKAEFLNKELVGRPKRIIPEEAFYALASVCSVRKDEDASEFDRTIHYQKMEAFRSAGTAGLTFFLESPTVALLVGGLLGTEAALKDLLISWAMAKARRDQVMRIASSTTD